MFAPGKPFQSSLIIDSGISLKNFVLKRIVLLSYPAIFLKILFFLSPYIKNFVALAYCFDLKVFGVAPLGEKAPVTSLVTTACALLLSDMHFDLTPVCSSL